MTELASIGPVLPERREEVLRLVFRDLLVADRAERVQKLLDGARLGVASLEGLVEARRGGELVGGGFSEVQPGRAAVVWPPRLAPGEATQTGERLLEEVSGFLDGKGIRVAHALLERSAEEDAALLGSGGFEMLAELHYLASLEGSFPRTRPASPLAFEPYDPAAQHRLSRLVEATYQRTLDCPRLNGVRRIEDILAGYRATGVFDPSRWLIVQHQGEDVGCLLLTDHPEQENWELMYMGLVPTARGNGWGQHMARYAQWLAHRAGRPRLVLAVDANNQPAIRMYWMVGFQCWERRRAYLKIFEPARRDEPG
jgi:ribosomal protein S18 acetylase RimI-like enzyme